MRLKLLQNDIGRYLEQDVWYKEDCQCYIVLGRTRDNPQIFTKAKDDGIGDVRPANHFASVVPLSRHTRPMSQSHLSKKAKRYKMLRHGISRKSILVIRRLSVVWLGTTICSSSYPFDRKWFVSGLGELCHFFPRDCQKIHSFHCEHILRSCARRMLIVEEEKVVVTEVRRQ